MPIRSREDFQDLTERVAAFFEAAPEQRPTVLRRLFTEMLDFEPVTGQLSLAETPKTASCPTTPSASHTWTASMCFTSASTRSA